ncbi:MAG: hypothetical protein JW934_15800 [Anaerolineae bacterium]|nr:hypothetical protein [Anaerolineae bacterium]
MDWTESSYSEHTAMRLARSGALIRVLCADDACDVCKAFSAHAYAPAEVPRLPIRGCQNGQCRCQFIAVDPQSKLTVHEMVQNSVRALRQKDYDQARQILRRVVELDEMNEQGWLWLSGVVEDREKITCLNHVLAINPRNKRAQAGLDYLHKKLPDLEAMPEAPATVEPQVQLEPGPIAPAQPEEPAAAVVEENAEPDAEPSALSPAVIQARQERQVIVAEWKEFLGIAVETDPQMLLMQGSAFLKQLARLNQQALEGLEGQGGLDAAKRLEELEFQWQESGIIGEPLADLMHGTSHQSEADWEPMLASLRQLAQIVLEHRSALREQIAAVGGDKP